MLRKGKNLKIKKGHTGNERKKMTGVRMKME